MQRTQRPAVTRRLQFLIGYLLEQLGSHSDLDPAQQNIHSHKLHLIHEGT